MILRGAPQVELVCTKKGDSLVLPKDYTEDERGKALEIRCPYCNGVMRELIGAKLKEQI